VAPPPNFLSVVDYPCGAIDISISGKALLLARLSFGFRVLLHVGSCDGIWCAVSLLSALTSPCKAGFLLWLELTDREWCF